MDERIKKLEEVQRQAYQAWLNADGIGTINVATGVGKTFIAFKCLYYGVKRGIIPAKAKVIFYAETDVREATLEEEKTKFKSIYGFDVDEDFDISFVCYQANKPLQADVKILDEIHFLGEKLMKQFEGDTCKMIGLTATTSESTIVNQITFLTKETIINSLAPVCFRYPLSKAIEEGVLSPYQTTIVEHTLDSKTPYIRKSKKAPNVMTEEAFYAFNKYQSTVTFNTFLKQKYGRALAKMLWGLRSKVNTVKALLKTLTGKTIIFGVELDLLELITENIVSGRKNKEENAKLIEDFNSGEIDLIASCKKLKQGITLEGVENCILVSYYSTSTDLIQQLGRVVRFVPDKMANLYIIVTQGTLEVRWVDKMVIVRDGSGQITDTIKLNLTA